MSGMKTTMRCLQHLAERTLKKAVLTYNKQQIDEEHACLLVHTKSGSWYRLLFADIDFNEMENTWDSLRKIKAPVDFLSQCETLYADSEVKKRTEADKILNVRRNCF